jgi:hypothetical protein
MSDVFTPEDIIGLFGDTDTLKFTISDINGSCEDFQEVLMERYPHTLWWVWVGPANGFRGIEPEQPKGVYGLYVGYMKNGDLTPACYFWQLKMKFPPKKKTKNLPSPDNFLTDDNLNFDSNYDPDTLNEAYRDSMKKLIDFIKTHKGLPKDGTDRL